MIKKKIKNFFGFKYFLCLGICVTPSQGPQAEDMLVRAMIKKIKQNIGMELVCQCKDKDPMNGIVQSKCNVMNNSTLY